MTGVTSTKNRSPLFTTKKYLFARLSSDQTSNVSTGYHIEYDNVISGSLDLSTGAGQANGRVSVDYGNIYVLLATLDIMFNSSSDYADLQFYDVTSSAYIGVPIRFRPLTSTTDISPSQAIRAYFEPTTDSQVELRIKNVSGSIIRVESNGCSLSIEEYEGFMNISLEDWAYAVFTNTNQTITGEKTFGAQTRFTDEATFAQVNNTPSSGTVSVNWSAGNKQRVTLDQDVTSTSFTNPSNPCNLVLIIAYKGGDYTMSLPSGIKWSNGSAPTLTETDGVVDIITLYFDGFSYYGSYGLNFS